MTDKSQPVPLIVEILSIEWGLFVFDLFRFIV